MATINYTLKSNNPYDEKGEEREKRIKLDKTLFGKNGSFNEKGALFPNSMLSSTVSSLSRLPDLVNVVEQPALENEANTVGSQTFNPILDLNTLLRTGPLQISEFAQNLGPSTASRILDVAGQTAKGIASGGIFGGLMSGFLGTAGNIIGAQANKNYTETLNKKILLANEAAYNHFNSAVALSAQENAFNMKSSIFKNGGKLYKKGSVLDVDEEALEKLKKQGYTFKILQ